MFQCCVAANAPWPRPPKASEHCFVMSISTKRRLCGVQLDILHKSHNNDNDDDDTVPLPLAAVMTKEEYDTQVLQPLQTRLEEWKGGYADAFLTTWAFGVIFMLIVAYMAPKFWMEHLHRHPYWIFAFMMLHLCGFYALGRYIRYENRSLMENVEHDLRQWHGIRVTMKRVAYLPHPTSSSVSSSGGGGMYCFCLAMQQGSVTDPDDEATLAVSEVEEEEEDEFCQEDSSV